MSKTVTLTLPSFNFGNGLVEIGALTTLIGSTVAEALVLGNRGSAGLVWGTISAFGSSSVIKACASAASPGWLRQVLGLRSTASDAAIGMDLPLARNFKAARIVRSTLDSPLGVSCDSDDQISMDNSPLVKEHHSCRDIYAFDRATSVMLDGLPATSPGNPLTVYAYASYPFFRPHDIRFQVSALALSLLKCFEVYFLLTSGGAVMGLLSAVPYTFFLFAATCVEIREISVSRHPMDIDGHVDLVAGALPTIKRLGGQKKVILGQMKNPRMSVWWRFIWAFGGFLHTVSLLMSYVVLSQQKTPVVLTWAGFQFTWLILRIFISHLTNSSEPMADRLMVGYQLDALTQSMKLRIASLILAVGNYQIHLHPRGIHAYQDDSFSPCQIARLLGATNIHKAYVLPRDNIRANSFIQVNIFAVIGDTSLSSATWMVGSTLTPMDLYDSCIIVFNSPLSQTQPWRTSAIPAARVLTAPVPQAARLDSENGEPLFLPRGAGAWSEIEKQTWMYWIPCDSGVWLQIKSKDLTVLGKCTAEVVDDLQLSKMLNAGMLSISLKDADEVKAIVAMSQKAADALLPFLH